MNKPPVMFLLYINFLLGNILLGIHSFVNGVVAFTTIISTQLTAIAIA